MRSAVRPPSFRLPEKNQESKGAACAAQAVAMIILKEPSSV